MQTEISTLKQLLRSKQLLQLKSSDFHLREQWSTSIQEKVIHSDLFNSSRSIALYQSLSIEVNTQLLFKESKQIGKKIAYPKINAKQNALKFFWVDNQTQFKTSNFGIPEPDESMGVSEASLEEIDLMLIPALAFDRHGYRLGRGQGFYDRTLKQFAGQRLGLAFSFQLLDEIPHESWDEKVDCLATEAEWIETL